MKTIDLIRHENLLQLISEAGSVQAVASKAGKSNAQISQLKTRSTHSGTGKPRSVGDMLARELEKAFNKPPRAGFFVAYHHPKISTPVNYPEKFSLNLAIGS